MIGSGSVLSFQGGLGSVAPPTAIDKALTCSCDRTWALVLSACHGLASVLSGDTRSFGWRLSIFAIMNSRWDTNGSEAFDLCDSSGLAAALCNDWGSDLELCWFDKCESFLFETVLDRNVKRRQSFCCCEVLDPLADNGELRSIFFL
mmetsp:Transcript_23026/g.48267  ORF Transcript_23026/g.48267 Transcript_23026/m.48267 type:complete len:147 (+) Transcript_23026:2768-3208(+)